MLTARISDEREIALSVIVRMVGGPPFVRRCLTHLAPQVQRDDIEVIVPYDATEPSTRHLAREFPWATFVDMGVVRAASKPGTPETAHELYDRRISQGLNAARGEVVAVVEDYGLVDPDWCEQVLAAHRLPYPVIGGAVEHAGSGPLNWALYFLDFGRYQLPLREGPVGYLTDVNVSYKRAALDTVRELWADRYNEVTVHWALARQGGVLWQRPQIVVRQDRGPLTLANLVSERFYWGRLFGRMRTQEIPLQARAVYVLSSPVLPVVLIARVARKVLGARRNRRHFVTALPQITAAAAMWCAGEVAAYVTGQ